VVISGFQSNFNFEKNYDIKNNKLIIFGPKTEQLHKIGIGKVLIRRAILG